MELCGKKQCPRFDDRKRRLQTLEWIRTRRWPKELELVDFDNRLKNKKWRPFSERRPAARYDIHSILTRDVIAMLAGEGRFPIISFLKPDDTAVFADTMSKVGLRAMLNEAATLASIGSVVIVPEIIVPEDVRGTEAHVPGTELPQVAAAANPWLTWAFWRAFEVDPVFRRDRPNVLQTVTRTWLVSRSQLESDGYDVKALDLKSSLILAQDNGIIGGRPPSVGRKPSENKFLFWYRRITLDSKRTIVFEPVAREVYHKADWNAWTEDGDRTTEHDLGFCPAIWYTTFDDPDARPDGACIFEAAVDNALVIDRVLSVAANAVVAAGTPQLAIARRNMGPATDVLAHEGQRSAEPETIGIDPDTVLQVDEKGGAWLVQLEGGLTPLDVVIGRLRSISLENVGGSRLSEEHAAGAKSGYAMELLNQALTYVSGLMRPGFERTALGTMRMLAEMTQKFGDIDCDGGTLEKAKLIALIKAVVESISYGPNYELSGQDKSFEVEAIAAAILANLMSQETGVGQIAQLFDVTDIQEELKRITKDMAAKFAQEQQAADADHKRNVELVKTKAAATPKPAGGSGA